MKSGIAVQVLYASPSNRALSKTPRDFYMPNYEDVEITTKDKKVRASSLLQCFSPSSVSSIVYLGSPVRCGRALFRSAFLSTRYLYMPNYEDVEITTDERKVGCRWRVQGAGSRVYGVDVAEIGGRKNLSSDACSRRDLDHGVFPAAFAHPNS